MSDLETRLIAALHADAPPARDPVFRVEVLVRLERARFRRRVAGAVAAVGVLAILAAVNVRVLGDWMAADQQHFWIVALAAAAALWSIPVVMIEPRFRRVVRAFGRWLYP
jgi:hypothetical protein